MVVIDTSVIIDHLRQKPGAATLLLKLAHAHAKENLALSVISVQELYEGKSTRERLKEDYLLATITPLRLLPYTYEIAQLAGEIARDRTLPLTFADAAVAATALTLGATLCTLDRSDFRAIEGLELYRD